MARRGFFVVTLAFFALWVFFHFTPQIDLWVSRLFYRDGHWLGQAQPFAFLREVYYRGSLIFALYIVIMAFVAIKKSMVLKPVYYQLIAALAVLGNFILVNRIFKEYFGRARPYKVEEFGGDALFSPAPFAPVDQCLHNCSFVSGEASGAMILILGTVALCGANSRGKLLCWIVFLPMAIMRIMAGKHFFSDVVLAMLLTAMVYWAMLWIIGKSPKDLWGSFGGLGRDCIGLFRFKAKR